MSNLSALQEEFEHLIESLDQQGRHAKAAMLRDAANLVSAHGSELEALIYQLTLLAVGQENSQLHQAMKVAIGIFIVGLLSLISDDDDIEGAQ